MALQRRVGTPIVVVGELETASSNLSFFEFFYRFLLVGLWIYLYFLALFPIYAINQLPDSG